MAFEMAIKPVVVVALLITLVGCANRRATTTVSVEPPPVHLEALAFDSHRDRLVLFGGGVAGKFPGETYEWNGQRWHVAVDSVAGPGSRSAHAMAYDVDARRIVLYGGVRDTAVNRPGVPLCDTWLYDGARWARANQAGCATTRAPANMVYDVERRAILLVEETPPPRAGTTRGMRIWQWRAGDWQLVDSAGPRRTALEKVSYDPSRATLVVPVLNGADRGTWEWRRGEWRKVVLADSALVPRSRYGLAYDPQSRRVMLIGGRRSAAPFDFLADVWTWDGNAWTQLDAQPMGPEARASATLIQDPLRGRLLYFGGASTDGRVLQELWIYDVRSGWAVAR